MAKKALCIGINNYPGTDSDLKGCINDANDWSTVLASRKFDVEQLLDADATKDNMKQAIENIVGSAQSGDTIVISYSGHGSYVPDNDGDEADGFDEILCPHDIRQNRPLRDDELYEIFNNRADDVRITFISDSCHSGTITRAAPIMDKLPETVRTSRFLPPSIFLPEAAVERSIQLVTTKSRSFSIDAGGATATVAPVLVPLSRNVPRPFGGVLLSGCQDNQTSADAYITGRWCGAFSHFALKALQNMNSQSTYREWYAAIRQFLPNQNFEQIPNLGGTEEQLSRRIFD